MHSKGAALIVHGLHAAVVRPWLWVLLICLPLQALAEIRLRDDRGIDHVLPRSPQRIVSLLPSLTESVCALQACERLVGTDKFSNFPERVVSLPKLGGLEDAQIERIAALRPDVVMVESSARVIDRLQSLGLTVMVFDAKTHADVKRTLHTLGRLLESQAAAEQAWQRIAAALAEAAARVPPRVRGQRVYFEIDATPYAAGPSSFIGETLKRLGMRNIVTVEQGAFPRLNPEFVVRARPDVIMAPQSNLADMPKRPGWGSLAALAPQRSCGFDVAQYELLIRSGPRMGEAALMLADCLSSVKGAR
jgi:iron complex transport system substrate-binding protein